MRNPNPILTPAGLWAFRLAILLLMFIVDNPFRLAGAGMLLALQIPLKAQLRMRAAAWLDVGPEIKKPTSGAYPDRRHAVSAGRTW